MTKELSKGFTGIEINGVRFSNISEMLQYMGKQRERIAELENDVELLKNGETLKELQTEVFKLTKENADLKCECRRCIYTDCILSDYGKDRNGICDHYKDVFDEVAELEKQSKAKKKQLIKAKDIMKRLVDLSNSSRSFLGGTWHETVREAENFLKESEVEK
jgi:hypothetical protein